MATAPDLEQLTAFAVFADHLNLSAAARELGLSQPALHSRLKRLAETLGSPLYRREGRGLALTETGRRTASFARELRTRVQDFSAELRGERSTAPICLCAGEGALLYLLGPALRGFSRRERLQLLVRDGEATRAAVLAGEAHLGVLSTDLPLSEDPVLRQELVAEVGFSLAVAHGDPLAERRAAGWSDLEGRALIVPPAGRPHRRILDAHLPESAEIAVEVGGWPLTLQLVALGLGVAVVNASCKAPRNVTLVPFADLETRAYVAIRDRRRQLDARAELLWRRLVG
ncbi:MAG: LysR family transcriptional regulator [Myxococcales bacterium]|nr:LysR family transcriptional regulator [Myxococcales bacterium]